MVTKKKTTTSKAQAERAAFMKRSKAAKRGAETRRANALAERRSEAARKAWATRRAVAG